MENKEGNSDSSNSTTKLGTPRRQMREGPKLLKELANIRALRKVMSDGSPNQLREI